MDMPISLGLFQTVAKLYAIAATIRMLAQYLNADFNHPFSQFIHRITAVPIRILRVVTPKVGGSDLLTPFVLVFAVIALEQYLILLESGFDTGIIALVFLTAAKIIEVVVLVLVLAVLATVVVSWIWRAKGTSGRITATYHLLYTFTEPLIRPVRRVLPPFGGLDFSPIVVLLGLEFIEYIGIGLLETIANRLFNF